MQQYSIYNEHYIDLIRENYQFLVTLCDELQDNGYWEQPEELLNSSIHENLDLYVQGVMVHFTVFCGKLSETLKSIIAETTHHNMLEITPGENYTEDTICAAKHIINGPPIILQLCSLYDYDKGTNMASVFIDRMVSVLLAFAFVDAGKDRTTMAFIEKYYEKSICFIHATDVERYLGKRYLFKKISNDQVMNYVELQQMEKEVPITSADTYEALTVNKTAEVQEDFIKEKDEEMLSQLQECKAEAKENAQPKNEKLDELLAQLDELIGLTDVKSQITSLINLIKVQKLRETYHMPTTDMTYHMVFTGNPGTGKTTVARLLSQIYCELGLLSKGTLVETDRSGMVAGFVGQTAIKVNDLVKSALGGVLFIDEAYSLTREGSVNDYGSEAIDTLVKLMEDNRDDLVVIVAGYTNEMKQFLKSNPGLVSRFNTFIEFPDYTTKELLDILCSMAEKSGVAYVKKALQKIENYLDGMDEVERKRFGNARGIRNLFEKNLMSQANRIVTIEAPTKKQISTIESKDVIVD